MCLTEAGARGVLDRVLKRFSQYSDQPIDKAVAEWALLAKESLFNNPNDYPSGNAMLSTTAQTKGLSRPFPAAGFTNAMTSSTQQGTAVTAATENKNPTL